MDVLLEEQHPRGHLEGTCQLTESDGALNIGELMCSIVLLSSASVKACDSVEVRLLYMDRQSWISPILELKELHFRSVLRIKCT